MCLKLYDEPHTDNRKQKMPLKPARCKITKKQITTSDSLQLRPSDFHHSVSIAASNRCRKRLNLENGTSANTNNLQL